MDYSTNLWCVSGKIRSSEASGGGDFAEDLKGGLDQAFKLNHKNKTLCIFLVTDAPGHGKQYNDDPEDDHYPDQPEGSLEQAFCQFKTLKDTNVHFTAFQLSKWTHTMFNLVKEAYGNNFTVTDKVIPEDFFATMFNSITTTIEETRLQFGSRVRKDTAYPGSAPLAVISEDDGGHIRVRATSITPLLPKTRQFEIDDIEFWRGLKRNVDERSLKDSTTLIFDPNEIGSGKTSTVFKVQDTRKGTTMVCKIDFRVLEGDIGLAYETAQNRWTSQIYAMFTA